MVDEKFVKKFTKADGRFAGSISTYINSTYNYYYTMQVFYSFRKKKLVYRENGSQQRYEE